MHRPTTLFAALLLVAAACDASAPTDATPAAASPPKSGTPIDDAATRGVASPAVGTAAPSVAPAPVLAELPAPLGPTAAGNVAADVAAAMSAKDCTIVDGKLADCPANEAYRAEHSNFVKAKAKAHADTMFNLLGAAEPSVRLLVLDQHPVGYVSSYDAESVDDPKRYEPLLAAALRETEPAVRRHFAWAVADIPVYGAHRRLVPYLGAIGEMYGAAQDGDRIVQALSELPGDCNECRDALVGIAHRNPDAEVRVAALRTLNREDVPTEILCSAAERNLDVTDEELASEVISTFTAESSKCGARYDAWLGQFVAKAKARALPSAWVRGAASLVTSEHAQAHATRLRKLGKELQAIVPEDDELRGPVDDLAAES
jgi:hypothetical protein